MIEQHGDVAAVQLGEVGGEGARGVVPRGAREPLVLVGEAHLLQNGLEVGRLREHLPEAVGGARVARVGHRDAVALDHEARALDGVRHEHRAHVEARHGGWPLGVDLLKNDRRALRVDERNEAEIRPEHVVEEVLFEGANGERRARDDEGLAGALAAVVGQRGEVAHVVEVGV